MSGLFNSLRKRLFGGGGRTQQMACSDGLIYAVGDIHGRTDLLEPLVGNILNDALREAELSTDPAPAPIVFMGDVIDRGPDTRGTIEFLMAVQEWPEFTPIFLLGNHEWMLLQFLQDPAKHSNWLRHGGYETLLSYNVGLSGDVTDPDLLSDIAARLAEAMGDHIGFLETFVSSHRNGNLLFAHAGVDPGLPMDMQPVEALVWGSSDFMRKRRGDDIWVVHGHTIVDEPIVRHGRISIDTGAYLSGVLTALKVHGEEISFMGETDAS